jgi:hypothetical protein
MPCARTAAAILVSRPTAVQPELGGPLRPAMGNIKHYVVAPPGGMALHGWLRTHAVGALAADLSQRPSYSPADLANRRPAWDDARDRPPPVVSRVKAVVVGFPKSGTSTIQESLARIGLRAVHQIHAGRPVAEFIYEGLIRHGDPFFQLGDVDAITQMDFCRPELRKNYWPNLDFSVLCAIRERHPDCKLILNYRDPARTADSIRRWHDLQKRIARADIPGLPRGYGATTAEIESWIRNHHQALRLAFGASPAFLEIDIASPRAPAQLGRALGVEIAWWGVANAGVANAGVANAGVANAGVANAGVANAGVAAANAARRRPVARAVTTYYFRLRALLRGVCIVPAVWAALV